MVARPAHQRIRWTPAHGTTSRLSGAPIPSKCLIRTTTRPEHHPSRPFAGACPTSGQNGPCAARPPRARTLLQDSSGPWDARRTSQRLVARGQPRASRPGRAARGQTKQPRGRRERMRRGRGHTVGGNWRSRLVLAFRAHTETPGAGGKMPVGLRMQGAAELVAGLGAAAHETRVAVVAGGACTNRKRVADRRGGRSAVAVSRTSASTSAVAVAI
jgi:hypothetical protein